MYNGIGLQTARGTGTNGYVQSNLSHLMQARRKIEYNGEEDLRKMEAELNKKPNEDIMDHNRKRQVEVKCTEFEMLLEDKGFDDEEIEKKVGEYRKNLLAQLESGELNVDKELDTRESHARRKAAAHNRDKMRNALGLNEDYVPGSSMAKMNKSDIVGAALEAEPLTATNEQEKEKILKSLRGQQKEKKEKKRRRKDSTSSSSSSDSDSDSESSSSSSSSEDEKEKKRKERKKKEKKEREQRREKLKQKERELLDASEIKKEVDTSDDEADRRKNSKTESRRRERTPETRRDDRGDRDVRDDRRRRSTERETERRRQSPERRRRSPERRRQSPEHRRQRSGSVEKGRRRNDQRRSRSRSVERRRDDRRSRSRSVERRRRHDSSDDGRAAAKKSKVAEIEVKQEPLSDSEDHPAKNASPVRGDRNKRDVKKTEKDDKQKSQKKRGRSSSSSSGSSSSSDSGSGSSSSSSSSDSDD